MITTTKHLFSLEDELCVRDNGIIVLVKWDRTSSAHKYATICKMTVPSMLRAPTTYKTGIPVKRGTREVNKKTIMSVP